MKPIHVAATVVRLFAISLFVYILGMLQFVVSFTQHEDPFAPILTSLIILFGVFVVALCLWNFPLSVAKKVTNILEEGDDQSSSMNADEFASICFFTLGLYLLYGLVGEFVYWVRFLNDPLVLELQQELPVDQIANLWALGFRTVLVVFLLVGNQTLGKFARWLRRAGQ
ncbi:MAG: hypothetical protein AAF431_07630 [Pseudomonadota bacterium]